MLVSLLMSTLLVPSAMAEEEEERALPPLLDPRTPVPGTWTRPRLKAPDLSESQGPVWDSGYAAGSQLAEGMITRDAFLLGAGTGFTSAGAGVLTLGVVGAPCVALGVAAPGVFAYRFPPLPESGDWEAEPVDFQRGYLSGYAEAGAAQNRKAAMLGGVLGVTVGTGAAIGALFLVRGLAES